MRLLPLLAAPLCLTLTACSDEWLKASAAHNTPPGGHVSANTQSRDVITAARFAAKELGAPLKSVDKATRQLVAGVNYHMTLTLKSGKAFNVTVYQTLDGKDMKLVKQQELKAAPPVRA